MRSFTYIGLMKLAEGSGGSDPELRRATEIFEDWLTTRKHIVRRGEVLTGVAKKYNIPLKELMEENGLQSVTAIKPGQQLRIPIAGLRKGGRGTKCQQ